MEKYEKRLDEEQWGELYNKEQAEQVINGILTEQVFCWTEELLKFLPRETRCVRLAVVQVKVPHICKGMEER